MAVRVKVTKDEWCTRRPNPGDQWDSGDYDGCVSSVEAEWYDGDIERPDNVALIGAAAGLLGGVVAMPAEPNLPTEMCQ